MLSEQKLIHRIYFIIVQFTKYYKDLTFHLLCLEWALTGKGLLAKVKMFIYSAQC